MSDGVVGAAVAAEKIDFFQAAHAAELRLKESWKARDMIGVVAAAEDVLSYSSASETAHRLRLKALLKLGETAGLAEAARSAVPFDPEAAHTGARKLAAAHDWEGAATVLVPLAASSETAMAETNDLRQRVASWLQSVGTQAAKAGDDAQAYRLWRLGLEVVPDHAELTRRVGRAVSSAVGNARALEFTTDPRGYVAAWQKVLEIDHDHVNALKRVATACEKVEDYDTALECWARLLRLDPTQTTIVQRMLRIALSAQKEPEALALVLELGGTVPEDATGERILRKVLVKCRSAVRDRDIPTAARHLVLLRKCTREPEVYDDLIERVVPRLAAQIKRLTAGGEPSEAMNLSHLLLELDPHNPIALGNLARYAYMLRYFSEAGAFYRRMVDADPSSAPPWLGLARSLMKVGDVDGAKAAARRCLELDPEKNAAREIVAAE